MCLQHLQCIYDMVCEYYSTNTVCYAFNYLEGISHKNIALHISDNHILYYHMDAYRSIMMGHSYFKSPTYLVVQGWIRSKQQDPNDIQLAGAYVHCYTEFFPGVVRYDLGGKNIVPCHKIAEYYNLSWVLKQRKSINLLKTSFHSLFTEST